MFIPSPSPRPRPWLLGLLLPLLLSGCDFSLANSAGQIGVAEWQIMTAAFFIMLLVVLPVYVLLVLFAWKYRATNKRAQYDPEWNDAPKLEFVLWSAPIIIIIILGIITWKTSHSLDPKKPIVAAVPEMTIQVVALDWKWLFIYPEQGVASINELALPVDTPVKFELTSSSVMNSFFIPKLGTQLYAMAGMNNILYLIGNEPGVYDGVSINYSGAGFSGMKFKTHVTSEQDFNAWISKIKNSQTPALDWALLKKLAYPSINHPVTYYSSISTNLYHHILHAPTTAQGFSIDITEAYSQHFKE